MRTATLSNFNVPGTSGRTPVGPKTNYAWPTTFKRDYAIKIEYFIVHGNAASDISETVRHALLMLVSHYYENRENELIGTISKTLPYGFDDHLLAAVHAILMLGALKTVSTRILRNKIMLFLDQLRPHLQRETHRSKQCLLNLGVNIRATRGDNQKVESLETQATLILVLSYPGRGQSWGQSTLVV